MTSLPAVLLGALAGVSDPAAAAADKPLDVGAEATVQVVLVPVDVVVLDARDRTVSDLRREEFVLAIDGKTVPIDTFDVDCTAGAVDEPRALLKPGALPAAAKLEGTTRRLAVVMDYYHLSQETRQMVFGSVRDVIDRGLAGDEEVMLAAFASGLRIEQPFTADRDQLLASLRRMEFDISLWAGNFRHLTEQPTFTALEALMEVLSLVPGAKSIVLFSDGRWPPAGGVAAFNYDAAFERVASMAGNARVSLYPVLASGVEIDWPG